MQVIDVLLVDDEPVGVRRLEALLRDIAGVRITGSAGDATEALALAQRIGPDLALIDIEMPGMNGIALASALRAMRSPPAVVFVTAFSRFAVEAFDIRATDYLLKPVEPRRLAAALDRVRKERDQTDTAERIAEFEVLVAKLRAAEHRQPANEQEVWLSDRRGADRVRAADIRWVQAERDYVHVHTLRRSYFIRGRLGAFEAKLAPSGMVRVHRSALVRAAAIARIEATGTRGYRLVLDDGTAVDASRRFAARVRAIAEAAVWAPAAGTEFAGPAAPANE